MFLWQRLILVVGNPRSVSWLQLSKDGGALIFSKTKIPQLI
jgi:hypothetical protein